MQRDKAISEESRSDKGFEKTHDAVGLPIRGADSDIRAKANQYNNDDIKLAPVFNSENQSYLRHEPRSLRPSTTSAMLAKLDPPFEAVNLVLTHFLRLQCQETCFQARFIPRIFRRIIVLGNLTNKVLEDEQYS